MRHQMMGWPADARRFLAGAFAGERAAPMLGVRSDGMPARAALINGTLSGTGAVSKTVTAPLESVRMQIMTGNKVSHCCGSLSWTGHGDNSSGGGCGCQLFMHTMWTSTDIVTCLAL